ncbi:target of rapamycin complex 1 subunit KOG1-like [Humulus lupulus]|uniref:target of rapamycin complex 1 subunit KOG1-like n=1 Tax=Humulus lupulus TaxID=3486 RepID=UPI002B41041C|nr:target of rapamycin complex 1 subunit KOG1-like [Humulus lupulus]
MLNNWIHVEQSLVNTGKERAKVSLLFTWAEGNVANQREHLILLLANIHIQKANKQSVLKSYTQYIPLPISDLDSWLKSPSIYVFDCFAAGGIL